eukprot:gene20934-23769_t
MEEIGAYEIQCTVGKGSFGVVKCATKSLESIKERYALKECRDLRKNNTREPAAPEHCQLYGDEEEDLSVLVTLYVPLGPVMHFEASTQQYVYNSALVERHNAVFEVEDVLRYFRDIVQAVAYLHRHNVCHRDIKPANILISSSFNLVLCDFGAAEQFSTTLANPSALHSIQENNLTGSVSNTTGSPADWAPEAIFPERFNADCGLDLSQDFAALALGGEGASKNTVDATTERNKIARFSAYGLDMWAMGVLLYEMFYLQHPFYRAELSELELFHRIADCDPFSIDSYSNGSRDGQYYSSVNSVQEDYSHSPNHALDSKIVVRAPDHQAQQILEGLLQKEPSMRWITDTLVECFA